MATSVHDLCPASITHAQSSFFYGMWQCQPIPLSCTFSPSTTTFLYVMPMLLYIWLLYAHLWPFFLHLQLPNTSLNGGNVCLATLHSSDRDLQPFYYVYMNTHDIWWTFLSFGHFANIFVTSQIEQKLLVMNTQAPLYFLRLTSEHFANIFVTTLTEQSL